MNDISQSKLLRPWAWIGRRKRPPIVLPPETLTNILHYFPRKQLVKRYSRVNSSFFNVANRLLPNVHVINNDNIRFSINEVYSEDRTCVQTFEALTLGKYQESDSRFGKAMNEILSCVRPKRDRREKSEIRIRADEFLENMPPSFIRFPKFSIGACPDEVLLKFLRDSKQYFENCRLEILNLRTWHDSSSKPDEKYMQKLEDMLTDTFLNPFEIDFGQNFASEKIFKTTGVRNCDRVILMSDRQCTKDSFIDWIQWKQNESGSRRHLVLTWWPFNGIVVQEMLEDLKHAFEIATKPLNYVITFATRYDEESSEFHLDNDHTRERLSLFKDKQRCFRLWRRTVTSSDSAWLRALIGGILMGKKVREARKSGFDEKFYNYKAPVEIDIF